MLVVALDRGCQARARGARAGKDRDPERHKTKKLNIERILHRALPFARETKRVREKFGFTRDSWTSSAAKLKDSVEALDKWESTLAVVLGEEHRRVRLALGPSAQG